MDYKIPRSDQTKLDNLELEAYGRKLGLYHDLIFLYKTKEQAYELFEIQYLCSGQYRDFYHTAKDEKIHDKEREEKQVNDAIDTLKSHLWKYHIIDGLELIGKLNEIQPFIDKLFEPKIKYVTNPKQLLDQIQDEIAKRLKIFNFSETAIKKEILPVFTAMIKNKLEP